MASTGGGPKGAWKVSEERYFYEYLRVAGDRSVEDCCRDISSTLGSKTVEQVCAFYQKTFQWLVKGKETCGMTNRKMHSILIKFYDTFVAPKRTQKKQDSVEELSGVDRIVSPPVETSKSNPQQIGSESHHVKEPADAMANLYAAQRVEILLVPFDENLANSIASSGCDPCPRLSFNPSQKIVGIIDQLRNSWDVALRHLGKGGVRLKAPEGGPVALKPLSWGDPIRDRELTLVDLMFALQISSPSTLGYVWESYAPTSIPATAVIHTNHIEKKSRASPEEDGRKSLMDILNSDSLPVFSPISKLKPPSPIDSSPKQRPGGNNVFEFVEQKRIPIGLNRLLGSQPVEKEKKAKRQKKRVSNGLPNEVPPGKILKNGWMQYAGAMQQIQNYNLMQGKYCPSHLPARGSSQVSIKKHPAFDPSWSIADKKEESLLEALQNQDPKVRLSIAEALKTTTPENLSSPQKMPPASTPQSNMQEDLHLNIASLSPPSSFKLPSEFHRFDAADSSPIRTLKGIFDSCYPTESPGNNSKQREQGKEGTGTLKEECNLSALDVIHPTTSILSFLDGLSNSKWMGMIDNDNAAKTDAQEEITVEKRPFAKLFDK
ncbi:hypothetical protein PSENEW3_00004318 [Picochlorum sp. SENEW3]|nr:hypothetical protein PSENEW3_00004318 [Picochlorum sp. SENEW3]